MAKNRKTLRYESLGNDGHALLDSLGAAAPGEFSPRQLKAAIMSPNPYIRKEARGVARARRTIAQKKKKNQSQKWYP